MERKSRLGQILRMISCLVGITLLLASCGQAAPSPTSAPAAAPTAAPAAPAPTRAPQLAATAAPKAEGEINMGLLVSLTGDLGDWGKPGATSAQIAVDEINAAGGVLGRKIKLIVEDERTDVQSAVSAAKKLAFNDKVASITGLMSDSMLALMDFAKDNKVPIVSHWAGTVKLNTTGGNYVFRTGVADDFGGMAAAKFFSDTGFKKAAFLFENTESPQSSALTAQAAFKKLGGETVASVAFNAGQTSYQAELRKVLAAKPEVILLSAGAEAGAVILKEGYRSGYKGKWLLAPDITGEDYIPQVGVDIMEGTYGHRPGNDVNSPAYKHFVQAWVAKGGTPDLPTDVAHMYDAFMLQALAMEAGKAATGEAINANIRQVSAGSGTKVYTVADGLAALRKGSSINYEGASGPVDLDQYGSVVGGYSIFETKSGKMNEIKFYSGEELGKVK